MATISGMKMRWIMLIVVHCHDNPIKSGNFRHTVPFVPRINSIIIERLKSVKTRYAKGDQSQSPFTVIRYFKFFLILSTASITFSRWPKADNRKYPSPLGPKPEPGVPTTLHSVRSLSKKSQLVMPAGVLSQM